MTLVWLTVVGLALWFGFELGRKWDQGRDEIEMEEVAERSQRGGVRLRRIAVRR